MTMRRVDRNKLAGESYSDFIIRAVSAYQAEGRLQ
jgi:hypothetical protein